MRNIETFPSKQMWQERREENQERRHFCQNCHILFWSEDLDVNIKCQKFQKRRCCISWSAKSENVAICRRISNLKNFVCFMSIFNEKQKSMYMLAFFFCCSLSHPIFPCPPFPQTPLCCLASHLSPPMVLLPFIFISMVVLPPDLPALGDHHLLPLLAQLHRPASELQGGAPPTQTRVPLVDNHWQVCKLMTDVNMIATTQNRCCLLFGWWKIACEQPLHRPDLRILCPGKYSAFDALQINCLLNSEYFVIKSNSLPMPNPL